MGISSKDEFVSAADLAGILKVNMATIRSYRDCDPPLIPYITISKSVILYRRYDVDKFLNDKYVK